jgi:hypothetical protein
MEEKQVHRGIRLSRIKAKLQPAIDLTPFLGKLQQQGIVKIIFDPALDEEPLVQLTEKGRQEIFELLFFEGSEVTK